MLLMQTGCNDALLHDVFRSGGSRRVDDNDVDDCNGAASRADSSLHVTYLYLSSLRFSAV